MKLHTVFITFNRLELTKRAVESYLETVSVPWTACIIDNGSTDGTEEWFFDTFNDEPLAFAALGENMYPGYATNFGWTAGLAWEGEDINPPPTHLHRADNDHIFLPGWCEEVERDLRVREGWAAWSENRSGGAVRQVQHRRKLRDSQGIVGRRPALG